MRLSLVYLSYDPNFTDTMDEDTDDEEHDEDEDEYEPCFIKFYITYLVCFKNNYNIRFIC